MAEPLLAPADDNDVSSAYMQHSQQQTQKALIEEFRASQAAKRAPAQGTPAAVAAPATEEKSVWSKVGSAAAAAGVDVAKGLFKEAPRAALGGVGDAFRNSISGAARALNDTVDWLNTNVADLTVQVPSTGNQNLDAIVKPFLAPGRDLADKSIYPDVAQPSSNTGHVIREGARFLTGFVPAMRVMHGAGYGAVGASLGAGAISDFATMDPAEKGLANLVGQVPALQPVVAPLMVNPDDPEILNRTRHAVEGLGFGGLTEGVVRGIRAIAKSKSALGEIDAQAQLYGSLDREASLMVADDAAPLVTKGAQPENNPFAKLVKATEETETGVPDSVAAKGVARGAGSTAKKDATPPAKTEPPELYINFARMNNPDDVNQVIRDMADSFKGSIDEARRGIQDNATTAKLADDLGMTVEDLLSRRKGQPFNAEEGLAARKLLNASAEKLLELSKKAADPNAGAADLYNFRRMVAIHHAVQSEVIAARTETARALQAWAIPAGGNVEAARAVQQMLDMTGGAEVTQEFARRMATLADAGASPGAIAAMARKGWLATTTDAVKESYVLGLLWNPSTHIVNSASNIGVAFQQVYERATAKQIGDFLGSAIDSRVVDGEALAMTYGLITSLKDALALSGRALKTGESTSLINKIDLPQPKAISTEAVARERGMSAAEAAAFAESPMGRALDFIGNVTRAPGQLLAAEDEFFKTVAYRAELHAQSLRQATQEGFTGPDRFKRMAEIVNDPPEHIRISAADAALYSTFQNKTGWFGEAVSNFRNSGSMNPTFMVLPFVKTPTNIMRYTFERTPLAPLVSQWRDDIAAGGARRDLALARMATGTAIMAVGMDAASSGLITGNGPKDPAKREALERQGWKPNSIYSPADGKYYSFNRADPIGMVLGFAGTVAEKLKESENSPEDFDSWEEIMAAGIGVLSATVVDKTYFTGVSRVLSAVQSSEKSSTAAAKWFDQQTGSMVPFSSALNVMKRFTDPVTREVNSPWDAIQARIAGLSQNLTPARDLWGSERKPQEIYGRVYDVISPVAVSQDRISPIDAEMERLQTGVKRIDKRGEFAGADVNFRDYPKAYDEYVRLAGNELKHPTYGVGAKDFLDAVVSGKHYLSPVYNMSSDGPLGGKAAFIKKTVSEYRKLAQDQIMSRSREFPDFTRYVEDRANQLSNEKFPLSPSIMTPPQTQRVNVQ
jgi:hypothetical protein